MSEQEDYSNLMGEDKDIFDAAVEMASDAAKQRKAKAEKAALMEEFQAEFKALGPKPTILQISRLKAKWRRNGLPDLW